jgi:hypothetical protein
MEMLVEGELIDASQKDRCFLPFFSMMEPAFSAANNWIIGAKLL